MTKESKIILSFFKILILYISVIKYCKPSCSKYSPFLKDGECLYYCNLDEISNEMCTIDNKIVKTQWINKINYLAGTGYGYLNFAITQNQDLLVLISSFPGTNERILYGINNEGRGYFNEEKKCTMTINDKKNLGKFESEILTFKLQSITSTKEYLLSYSKTPQYIEFYDITSKKIINFAEVSTFFETLNDVRQHVGAYLKLTVTNKNYYLIGLISIKYDDKGKGTPILSLIKFSITSLSSTTIKRDYSKVDTNVYDSRVVSCYELSTLYIVCFYKNTKNKYTMGVFNSNLNSQKTAELASGDNNDLKFFKCCHFNGEIGAFIYYSNENPPHATIELKKYSNNQITNEFSKIVFSNYEFYYNITNNDIIKVFDKKIYFVAVSLDKTKLYVISIYNYDQQKIMKRIYEINSFAFNEFYFYNTIRIQIYNNYLAFGSNGFSTKGDSFSALIIFSYPNSTDINNEISEYLFNNNQIKINNIQLSLRDICNIENNIFGHILTGIIIPKIYKDTNHYLALQDGTEIEEDNIIDIDEILKLMISKTDNIYTEFNYGMKYACRATEPEYEEYNQYVIESKDTGTSNKENSFFDSQKQVYTGRYSYHYFQLSQELTEEGCNKNCELCYNDNKNKCVTCLNNDYDLLNGNKKCKELIITTIPIIETTIPKEKVTTIPIIETTFPKIIETTIQILETTIIKIDNTLPKIESTIPVLETNILDKFVDCTAKNIIEGMCMGNLTDEMADEINFYIKTELINSNLTENLIVKTPSIAYQLTSLDYQINNNLELSIIDLGECEKKIKEENNIPEEYDLIIYKIDIQNKDKSLTYVQYEIYDPIKFKQLSLYVCQNLIINITIPTELDNQTLLLYQNLENQGYNIFDSEDDFYNDICSPYTSINNTDILLIDRKKDIYSKYANITLCQENCKIESYNDNSKTVSCYCDIQSNDTNMDLNILSKFNISNIKDIFFNYLNNSNFRVLKCYKNAIDLTTIFNNIGRIIMTVILFIFIILFILFLIKGNQQLSIYIKQIINSKLINKKERKNTKNNINQINELKTKTNKLNLKTKETKIKKKNNIKKIKDNNKVRKTISNPIKTKNIIKGNKDRHSLSNFISKKLSLNKNKILKNSIKSNSNLFKKDSSLITPSISSQSKLKKSIKTNSNKNNILVYNIINNYNNKKSKSIKKKKTKEKIKPFLNDQELNKLDYNKALILDKRTYMQYYVSLLKRKHLILFAFLPIRDYNLQYIKIMLFLISFSLYFVINGFFFSDETMHQIYEDCGLINYLNQIVSILYSSIIPAVINIILKLLSLSENDILSLKQQKDSKILLNMAKEIETYMKIKFTFFFIICYILLFFFWYFISCFCGVYKNTQILLITDTLISFGISMIYPFGLNLLPGIFRIPALRANKKDKKCLYQFSSLVALI